MLSRGEAINVLRPENHLKKFTQYSVSQGLLRSGEYVPWWLRSPAAPDGSREHDSDAYIAHQMTNDENAFDMYGSAQRTNYGIVSALWIKL